MLPQLFIRRRTWFKGMNRGCWKLLHKLIDGLANIGTDVKNDRFFLPREETLHVNKRINTYIVSLKPNNVEAGAPYEPTNKVFHLTVWTFS